jgi:hypothetical protein
LGSNRQNLPAGPVRDPDPVLLERRAWYLVSGIPGCEQQEVCEAAGANPGAAPEPEPDAAKMVLVSHRRQGHVGPDHGFRFPEQLASFFELQCAAELDPLS